METYTEKHSTSGKKNLLITSGSIIILFILYFLIMSLAGARRKASVLNDDYNKVLIENGQTPYFTGDSAYIALLRERSFLQARLKMAASDSLYISVNLSDSLINLEIKGVTVHRARISSISRSRIMRESNNPALIYLLSEPLSISESFASIPKEPLMIKIAPKDTSEYQPDIMPDTSGVDPVNFILHTGKGIAIQVCQSDNLQKPDKRSTFIFDLKCRIRTFTRQIRSVLRFKVPEYEPFIRITIPRDDARVIYRALPDKGEIGLFL